MLTKKQLDLIWQIENICRRSIMASKYCDAVTGSGGKLWGFTQNCYGEICIIYWCKIFGSKGEPTHYSKLFKGSNTISLPAVGVKARLRKSVRLTATEYDALWKQVKDCRDKFFVHDEFETNDLPVFPDLAQLREICLEMRTILKEIVISEESEDREYQQRIFAHFQHNTNEAVLAQVAKEVGCLSAAVGQAPKPH